MGKLDIKEIGGFSKSELTLYEYDHEATYDSVCQNIKKIMHSISIIDNNYSCYIVGMGGQPKSLYTEISNIDGAELIFFSSVLPNYLKFLSPIVASYSGLIKINKKKEFISIIFKID